MTTNAFTFSNNKITSTSRRFVASEAYTNEMTQQNVWSVFSDIASSTGATNLGQGFPDWKSPSFVLQVYLFLSLPLFLKFEHGTGLIFLIPSRLCATRSIHLITSIPAQQDILH